MTSEQTVYNWESSAESGQWKLIVREEGTDTEHALVTGRNYVIGRSQESDIMITNSQSSRKHAALIYKDSHWYVKDLKSKNGVSVGSKKIQVARLDDGDSFIIVGSRLTLSYESADQPLKKQGFFDSEGKKKKIFIGAGVAVCLLMIVAVLAAFLSGDSGDSSSQKSMQIKHIDEKPSGDTTFKAAQDILLPTEKIEPIQQPVASAGSDSKERARELYRQGLLFYDNGNLTAAIDLWDKAMFYDRENNLVMQKLARATKELDYQVTKHFNLAQNHIKYQRLFEAERELTIVLGLIKDESDTRYQKASNQLTQLQKK